jgi:hypothetical protein
MEKAWTDAIERQPTPAEGVLTERALDRIRQPTRPARHRPVVALGFGLAGVALASIVVWKATATGQPNGVFALDPQPGPIASKPVHRAGVARFGEAMALPVLAPIATDAPQVVARSHRAPVAFPKEPLPQRALAPVTTPRQASVHFSWQGRGETIVPERAVSETTVRLAFEPEAGNPLGGRSASAIAAPPETVRLTPLPGAANPAPDGVWPYQLAFANSTGTLVGTIVHRPNPALRGEPVPARVVCAVFDAAGILISTATAALPAEGGTARLDFGTGFEPGRAAHFLLGIAPQAPPRPESETIVGGWQRVGIAGKPPLSLDGRGPGRDATLSVSEPEFAVSNIYRDTDIQLTARLSGPNATPFSVHVALFNADGGLAGGAAATVTATTEADMPLHLMIGPEGSRATRYQLALVRSAATPAPDSLHTEATELTVGTVTRAADGTVVLNAARNPLDGIWVDLQRPESRDQITVTLTPDAVAELKERGLTAFEGATVRATGPAKTIWYLSFPAWKVQTVTVTRGADLIVLRRPDPLP